MASSFNTKNGSVVFVCMNEIIVFAGPSLPKRPDLTWKPLLEQVQLRPPAQHGDLLAVMNERPRTLVLLDGYYFDGCNHIVPAVKPEELLSALGARVKIIGAASMGAIYAAELSQYGITGIGQVFEWFRDGILQGSDELVILHLPEEFGYQHMTIALVEIRYALQQLVNEQIISTTASQSFIQATKELPFTERSSDVILQLAYSYLNESSVEILRRSLISNSVKQADAKLALQLACSS
jgi:hypothetical protein